MTGERENHQREKYQLVASCTPPTRDLAPNPGKCPDRKSNQRPFALRDGAQPMEPHWSGQGEGLLNAVYNKPGL